MPVQYTQAITAQTLLTEIEAVFDWQSQLLRAAFYPGSNTGEIVSAPPTQFVQWCEEEVGKGNIDKKMTEKILMLHEDIGTIGKKIVAAVMGGETLSIENYDALEQRIDAYIMQLRRLEQDLMTVSTAVDHVTGLRTVTGMRTDLKREQDRLDRKGTSYCLGNIAIDNVDDLTQKYDRKTQDVVYAAVAQTISHAIRSFDDAYYMGRGEYLLCLKHVEFMDACAVMDRLRAQLADTPVHLKEQGDIDVTVSIGVAEALPKEDVDFVLNNSKSALKQAKEQGGNRTQEYQEMSALQKYALDKQEG